MIKLTAFFITTILLVVLLVWLWQRQPKAVPQTTNTAATSESKLENHEQKSMLLPEDGTTLNSSKAKVSGQTDPNSQIAIFSNDFQYVTNSNDKGEYNQAISLNKGLNLISLTTITVNLDLGQKQTITLWSGDKGDGKYVVAGQVKSIFDTLISVSTPNGDKNVRVGKSTDITIPKEKEASSEAVKNIRVGDYAIALGDPSTGTHDSLSIVANKLQIIRDNKPQNSEEIATGTTASIAKLNIFSLKNTKDSNLLEFTISKNSDISLDGKSVKQTDIAKDKKAIVIYYNEDDKKFVDLIYLLP